MVEKDDGTLNERKYIENRPTPSTPKRDYNLL